MSADHARQIASRYFETHDLEALAPDITYVNMATGEESKGRDEVAQMLAVFYEIAFRGSAEVRRVAYFDGGAVMEFDWTGEHIGEFAGIPPTGRTVQMPCCLVVEVGSQFIERAHLYPQINRVFEGLTT